MTTTTRRIVQTLLLAGSLVGCASQHPRTESANGDTLATRNEGPDHTQMTPVVPNNDLPGEGSREGNPVTGEGRIASDVPGVVPGDALPPAATDESSDPDRQVAAKDNTAVNERDRNDRTLTPTDQSNDKRDLEITRRIRETVVGDDTLSFTAKNIKIITVEGRVTLRGPVKNDNERRSIEKKALAVAGDGQVVNQLEVQ